MDKQIIITGAPRSGSRHLFEQFGQAKISGVDHERDGEFVTISPYLAVDVDLYPARSAHQPYWNRHVDEVWHYTRHPIACISSLAAVLSPGFSQLRAGPAFLMWQLTATGMHPKMWRSRREFCAAFWVRWNEEAEARKPCWRFQMEDIVNVWPEMWDRLGLGEAPPLDSRASTGSSLDQLRKQVEPISWDELKSWGPSIYDSVRHLAERYGYEE